MAKMRVSAIAAMAIASTAINPSACAAGATDNVKHGNASSDCRLAQFILGRYLSTAKGVSIVISDGDLGPIFDPVFSSNGTVHAQSIAADSPSWREGWEGEHPSLDLARRFSTKRLVNAFPCLKNIAKSYNVRAVSTTSSIVPGDVRPQSVERISLPILSSDDRSALFVVNKSGPLSGSATQVFFFRMVKGSWRESGSRTFSLS